MHTINKNKTPLLLVTCAAVALTGTALAGPPLRIDPARANVLPNRPLVNRIDPDRLRPLVHKPDLAVKRITVSPFTDHRGYRMARIQVTIKNRGLGDWVSGAHQQGLVAYVGRTAHSIHGDLTRLRAGHERTFQLRIPSPWGPGVEFPPALNVILGFDPDIFIDGNRANDDADTSNNRKSLTGAQLNAMMGG